MCINGGGFAVVMLQAMLRHCLEHFVRRWRSFAERFYVWGALHRSASVISDCGHYPRIKGDCFACPIRELVTLPTICPQLVDTEVVRSHLTGQTQRRFCSPAPSSVHPNRAVGPIVNLVNCTVTLRRQREVSTFNHYESIWYEAKLSCACA